ncbi:hypothetical protein [Nostoc sp.]
MQGSEKAKRSLFSHFPLLKIDGGAIENAFPGGTWERVLNF